MKRARLFICFWSNKNLLYHLKSWANTVKVFVLLFISNSGRKIEWFAAFYLTYLLVGIILLIMVNEGVKQMNNFELCMSIGKEAEDYVAEYFAAKGHQVIDVSGKREFQKIDIDLLLVKNGKSTTLEVKHDSKMENTKNFFFEVGFDRKTGYYDGWFKKCEAEYICFVGGKRCYIVRMDKKVIAANGTSRRWCNYTDCCYGDALLLSIDKARELGLIVYEWTIDSPYEF